MGCPPSRNPKDRVAVRNLLVPAGPVKRVVTAMFERPIELEEECKQLHRFLDAMEGRDPGADLTNGDRPDTESPHHGTAAEDSGQAQSAELDNHRQQSEAQQPQTPAPAGRTKRTRASPDSEARSALEDAHSGATPGRKQSTAAANVSDDAADSGRWFQTPTSGDRPAEGVGRRLLQRRMAS